MLTVQESVRLLDEEEVPSISTSGQDTTVCREIDASTKGPMEEQYSVETSTTALLDDSDQGSVEKPVETDTEYTASESSKESQRSENRTSTKREPRDKSTTRRSMRSFMPGSKQLMRGDILSTTSDSLGFPKKQFDNPKSLRSFMPSVKVMIEDDTESTSSDSTPVSNNFRYRRRSDGSSLDLIYGNGEISTYFSDVPLRKSIEGSVATPASIDTPSDITDTHSDFASSLYSQQNQSYRVSKNQIGMKALRIEALCYNHGIEIAMGVLYFATNYLVAAHGAYQFTEAGGWTTDNDILRITMPIARAGGRLVTLNCALLLLTGCKHTWTLVRTHVAPVIPIGFPIDNIMPKYHRYVALTVIVAGCIVHSLPQIVNYASKAVSIDQEGMKIWSYWDELATKQLLLSGTLLVMIFSTFYVTTLKAFRKTTAGFRWFWFFHVGGIATAYPLLLIHGTFRGRPVFLYVASFPLLLYIFDIFMRRLKITSAKIIRWHTFEDEGQEITELVVECPPNFDYTPGQYVGLKFKPISRSEWHPFTIASAPNERSKDGKKRLVFYIKNSGRWTDALYEYASAFDLSKAKKELKVYIQGPHGAATMNYFAYKHIIVIGSGVGVTPLLSIWKYLVAKGKSIAEAKKHKRNSLLFPYNHKSIIDACNDVGLSNGTENPGDWYRDVDFAESLDMESAKNRSTIRADCIFVQSILESMTVSLSLFTIFVLGETFTLVLQMFGSMYIASTVGYMLSVLALVVHGTTFVVSTIAMGWNVYRKQFRCLLEFSIIFLDSIAIWYSIWSNQEDPQEIEEKEQMYSEGIIIYFTIFTYVVILHAIRIFHMFYIALKPAVTPPGSMDTTTTKRKKNKKESPSMIGKEEICSVEGILINHKYSSMRFAAKDLLPPIVENGLSDLFSMQFYGTRENSMHHDQQDRIISNMMRDSSRKKKPSDIKASLLNNKPQSKFFCAGRPDWNRIFLKAIAKAHCTNEEGESVGVFFCGSPAIAKELQAEAKRVTAHHQFAIKQLDGKPCKCRLMVHNEIF